jgi:hypothetical protein
MLGQLPTVLAPHVAQQPTQIGQHPPARLGPGEPPSDLGMQRPKPRRPPLDFLDGCCLVGFRHGPLALHHAGAAGTIPAGGREPYLTSCQVRLEY